MAQTDEGNSGAAGGGKTKLAVIAVVGVLVLAGAGVGGAWALGLFGGVGGDAAADAAGDPAAQAAAEADETGGGKGGHGAAVEADPIFVDLPHLLVNLVSEGGGTRFLKLSLAVEVSDEDTAARIERLAPRIVDSFQLYLRTLTADELRGPGSMFRLKEDLHVRIHQAIEPAQVRDVLFKEMLVQ